MENTFSYCFLHFLTFSQLPNKYIIQFFNRLTQIRLNSSKPNKKKFIKPGQIQQNPTISQSRTQCDRFDRCRRSRSRSRTAILASRFAGEVNGCDSKSKLWVRGAIQSQSSRFVVRSLWVAGEVEARGSSTMASLLPLSLSLSLRAGAISLAHSLSLSVLRKMVFEGKIKTEINLHHKHVRTEKHFRKMHFPCATKHPHLRKSIFGNHFQPIQTEPKYGT